MLFAAGRRGVFFAGIAALAILFLTGTVISADDAGPAAPGLGPLDGMVFVGRIGPKGAPDFDEELHFNNGYFWSKNCLLCGYRPSVYWVRAVGGGVRFQGELTSEDGSSFHYSGYVTDGRITVNVRWRKARWYWSIDRTLVFEGRLDAARAAIPFAEAGQRAATARTRPLPGWCT